jgi:uncharacterized protein YndB with AHSA1/START domain
MAVKTKPPVRKKALAKAARPVARLVTMEPRSVRLAGVGSDAVMRATGKGWNEWLDLLDREGAKQMPHKDIALFLSRKCGVPNWWSQMVTVGYEQARGLRDVYQHADGYAANTSRTFDVGVQKLFAAWSDPKARTKWLPKAPLEVRRTLNGKRLAMTWTTGGSRVEVNFFAKGEGRSLVQVEHAKLPSAASVTRQKAYWAQALGRLKSLLEDER